MSDKANTTIPMLLLSSLVCIILTLGIIISYLDRDNLGIALFSAGALITCPLFNKLFRSVPLLNRSLMRTILGLICYAILFIPALNGISHEAAVEDLNRPLQDNPHPHQPGYYNSPWPGEDGGYQRLQISYAKDGQPVAGMDISDDTNIKTTERSLGLTGSMGGLRDPGQLYLHTSSFLRTKLGLPTYGHVELIDSKTLKTIRKSVALKAGLAWPGGMAIHRNGDIYTVYGNWVHRLDPELNLIKSYELPLALPYNSFVILDNGNLVMKAISEKPEETLLTILDPITLASVTDHILMPEPSVARLSAQGNTIYVVGTRSIFRYHWDEQNNQPALDSNWHFDYIGDSNKTYGWDPVIGPDNAWFLDNGHHNFFDNRLSLINAGLGEGQVTLVRVSLTDSSDTSIAPISGLPYGTVSNTAVYATDRHIAVGYDAGNKVMAAFTFSPETKELTQLWKKENFGVGGHMIYYPATGELITNDYTGGADTGVILDIETGREKTRVNNITSFTQYVLFPVAGWERDYYNLNFDKIVRVYTDH